jgi:metal-responsive CopG/Arc/MetJ family transcriptional regulator
MTNKSARLNIRLPEKDLQELEAIRERVGLQSISDVVRDGITAYLHDEESSWNSEKIKAIVPNALMEDVEMFIASGDATDISQAVTIALAGWVEEKKRYYLEGKDAIRQKVGEAIEQRATRKGMARSAARMRVQ